MASRRVRIKGIANIPQRRKPNIVDVVKDEVPDISDQPQLNDETNLTFAKESHVDQTAVAINNTISDVTTALQSPKIENGTLPSIHIECETSESTKETTATVKNLILEPNIIPIDANTTPNLPQNTEPEKNIQNNDIKSVPIVQPQVPARRKFIKPQIAVNTINRKKEKPIELKPEPNKESVQELVNVQLNETVIAPNVSPIIQQNDQSSGPLTVKIPPLVVSQRDHLKSGSDTEYPPPPASPSKLMNRRIKAVPRLNQRRPSFSIGSASESEDDSRRTFSRVRNDSVCSVASAATDTQPIREAMSPSRKDLNASAQPRKFRRTDHGRKIAEARRNFYRKFTNGKPDKQKLTMIDLIYYNPATNPMNPRKRKTTSSSIASEVVEEVVEQPPEEEEKEDDPVSEESEIDTLAPQIKVGPNGEIVIDEKSLVIENSAVKKGRQALEKAEVIDGDVVTQYGIYKRTKRSKEWTNEETLRFYKALNTIGTDFTMMGELFPNRTRRELKMKFKKEERSNRALVDRAVMQPVEFDMTELKRDLEEFERLTIERKARAEETLLAKERQRRIKLEVKKKPSPKDDAEPLAIDKLEVKKEKKPAPQRKRKRKNPYDCVRKGIDSLLEDSDVESDDEYVPYTKEKVTETKQLPQRTSRRICKKIIEEPAEKEVASVESVIQNPNMSDMEPGSLMIVPSKDSTGNVVYKVFMVTDEKRKHQIDIDQQTLDILKDGHESNGKILNVQSIITISADADINGGIGEVVHTSDTIPHTKTNLGNHVEITNDGIMFPFEECPLPNGTNQNITISHEDNKMTIVTEDK